MRASYPIPTSDVSVPISVNNLVTPSPATLSTPANPVAPVRYLKILRVADPNASLSPIQSWRLPALLTPKAILTPLSVAPFPDANISSPDIKIPFVVPANWFTLKEDVGNVVPTPTKPNELIVILVDPLVSNCNDWASFVPKRAVAPKLFPFWIKAFAAFIANEAVVAFAADVANEALVALAALVANEAEVALAADVANEADITLLAQLAVPNNEPVNPCVTTNDPVITAFPVCV